MSPTGHPVSRTGFSSLPPRLPSGRTAPAIPGAARTLVDNAVNAGWLTLVYWDEDSGGSPFLHVEIGVAQPRHHFRLSWHTRGQHADEDFPFQEDVSNLRPRLFSSLDSSRGASVTGPSLKTIRLLIGQHRQDRPPPT